MQSFTRLLVFIILLSSLVACASAPVDTTTDASDYFNQHEQLMLTLPSTILTTL